MSRDHVLVIPGGGYGHLSINNRALTPPWLDELGLANTVVDYPVADTHPTPLGDGPLRAVRAAIRERRAAGDERVAVIGFSAGGHLAGDVLEDAGGGLRRRGPGLGGRCCSIHGLVFLIKFSFLLPGVLVPLVVVVVSAAFAAVFVF